MNDEKYITIEHDKWKSFYEPLEQNYNKVCEELQQEKNKKSITVYFKGNVTNLYHNYSKQDYKPIKVGYIDLQFTDCPLLRLEQQQYLIDSLKNEINDILKKDNFTYANIFLTDDIGRKYVLDMTTMGERIEKEKENLMNIYGKIKSIPKIIRWLFKIK